MKKINLYLTNLQHRELKDKAYHDDISMSELVREAIEKEAFTFDDDFKIFGFKVNPELRSSP